MALLERLGWLRPDLRVLDFGCGPGSLAPLLGAVLGAEGRYRGLDIHEPSIEWCRRAFAGDSRLTFEWLDPAASAGWPAEAGSWDLVLAKSVFTHLLEPEATRALAEIRRALAPGGRAMITAFLFDRSLFSDRELPWFPCPGPTAAVRWRRASRPTAAVAVDFATFRDWIAAAELRVEATITGFHPGGAETPTGQDSLLLAHRESER
jgi:SAM-dependent methyltransferase